jgi:hypothetical protein
MSEWQPIETCPKRGEYDIWLTNGVREANVHFAKFAKLTGWADRRGAAVALVGDASHWMPLPNPPVTK